MTNRTEAQGGLGRHRVDLPPDPHSTSEARALLRRVLAETSVDLDAVALVVSELVTNAVVHARTPLQLTLHWPPVRIEVRDLMPLSTRVADLISRPQPLPMGYATGGRGLPIARAIATQIGVEDHGAAGKTIWAEFGTTRHRMDELAADLALTEARLTVTQEQLAKTRADAAQLRREAQATRRWSAGRTYRDLGERPTDRS